MQKFSPSFWDKLFAFDHFGEDAFRVFYSKDRIKEGVARDIEAILNSRAPCLGMKDGELPNVESSLLALGLLDISSLTLSNDGDRRKISESIRVNLTRHDARLSQVVVEINNAGRDLVFGIKAVLTLHSDCEPVIFDAVLQAGSGRYEVSRSV